jgi:hypothetical protein
VRLTKDLHVLRIDVCVGAVVSCRLVRVLLVAAVMVLAWMRTPASQRRRTTVTANLTVSGPAWSVWVDMLAAITDIVLALNPGL